MICDAGFAIPEGLPVVDLSLAANLPTVDVVLTEVLKFFSVEKVIFAQEQRDSNPEKLGRRWPCWASRCSLRWSPTTNSNGRPDR